MQTLANVDIADFLANYWQRKPLVIRKAFAAFKDPIDADELAGFACEPDVESRLVIEKPAADDWQLRHGPFTARDFSKLPKSHWTLLVQAVDLLNEDVAALKRFFRFIPDWRLDDVMISFAAPQGSVGPHFDNYDVFLLQGQGSRAWRLGQYCSDNEPLKPHPSLRLLKKFEMVEEVVLQPGDVLYVPPRIAHWGIAQTETLTYSIGYRAPSVAEILSHLVDDIGDSLSDRMRYTDPMIDIKAHPARIPEDAIARVRTLVAEALIDDNRIRDWFGRYMTEPKYADQQPEPDSWPLPKRGIVTAAPDARFAFTDTTLFVNGRQYGRSEDDAWLIELIDQRCIDIKKVKVAGNAAIQLLQQLFDDGVLGTDE